MGSAINLVPGFVLKGATFRLQFVLPDGGFLPVCNFGDEPEYTMISSPSGTGKSTLLESFVRTFQDSRPIEAGQLNFVVDNKDKKPPVIKIGYVPQSPPLVLHWPVSKFVPSDCSMSDAAFPDGWEDVQSRKLGELSGGQQKRIYALSALNQLSRSEQQISIMVLDETLDGLGPVGAGHFLDSVSGQWNSSSSGQLFFFIVSHLSKIESIIQRRNKIELSIDHEEATSATVRVRVAE